ncbi:PREDICTED: endonuclease G, mitochondrial-like, partial [Rhagoletis zephyria]
MNKRLLKNVLVCATAATCAYFTGKYVERQQVPETEWEIKTPALVQQLERRPALPIFGTVSAAVPVPAEEVNLNATPTRISQIMKYGFPGLDHVRSYSDFVLSYDRRNRVPHWVFEHLTPESVARNDAVDRSKCEFRADDSI